MTNNKKIYLLLFVFILAIGVVVRMARFPDIPPGFNQDEANSATETYSLLKTGKDKWGNPYPSYFPSWGSGQSVLMAYLSIPFVKVFGLTIFSARLVSLFIGILTLPLFFFCLLPFGRYTALTGLLLLAVAPWHFMMSRWALECNLVPFFMLWGCVNLHFALTSHRKSRILFSLIPFALALYSYGITIIVCSVFLSLVLLMNYKLFAREWKTWLLSVGIFIVLALPFLLFFVENYLLRRNLAFTDSLFFSTPLCPINRLDQGSSIEWSIFVKNIDFLIGGFNDGTSYNILQGFSVLISFIFPLSILAMIYGLGVFIKQKDKTDSATIMLSLMIAWMLASLTLTGLLELNINRFNHFFIPCIALFAWSVGRIIPFKHTRWLTYSVRASVVVWISVECFFAIRYYFSDYPNDGIRQVFFAGLEEAFHSAEKLPVDQIQITQSMQLPYVYTLFYTAYPPEKFQAEAVYELKDGAYKVNYFGKYVFYEEFLDKRKAHGYLSRKNEFHETEGQRKTIVFSNEEWEVGIIE